MRGGLGRWPVGLYGSRTEPADTGKGEGVVHNMINGYKAPIASKDIAPIVSYLAQSKRN